MKSTISKTEAPVSNTEARILGYAQRRIIALHALEATYGGEDAYGVQVHREGLQVALGDLERIHCREVVVADVRDFLRGRRQRAFERLAAEADQRPGSIRARRLARLVVGYEALESSLHDWAFAPVSRTCELLLVAREERGVPQAPPRSYAAELYLQRRCEDRKRLDLATLARDRKEAAQRVALRYGNRIGLS